MPTEDVATDNSEHRQQVCYWNEISPGLWSAECGPHTTLPYGTPKDHQFYFCPFCGRSILVFKRCLSYDYDPA